MRFNQIYRGRELDAYDFNSLEEVGQQTDPWMEDYNFVRPCVTLRGMSVVEK